MVQPTPLRPVLAVPDPQLGAMELENAPPSGDDTATVQIDTPRDQPPLQGLSGATSSQRLAVGEFMQSPSDENWQELVQTLRRQMQHRRRCEPPSNGNAEEHALSPSNSPDGLQLAAARSELATECTSQSDGGIRDAVIDVTGRVGMMEVPGIEQDIWGLELVEGDAAPVPAVQIPASNEDGEVPAPPLARGGLEINEDDDGPPCQHLKKLQCTKRWKKAPRMDLLVLPLLCQRVLRTPQLAITSQSVPLLSKEED